MSEPWVRDFVQLGVVKQGKRTAFVFALGGKIYAHFERTKLAPFSA